MKTAYGRLASCWFAVLGVMVLGCGRAELFDFPDTGVPSETLDGSARRDGSIHEDARTPDGSLLSDVSRPHVDGSSGPDGSRSDGVVPPRDGSHDSTAPHDGLAHDSSPPPHDAVTPPAGTRARPGTSATWGSVPRVAARGSRFAVRAASTSRMTKRTADSAARGAGRTRPARTACASARPATPRAAGRASTS
jgi:hypothetical protein